MSISFNGILHYSVRNSTLSILYHSVRNLTICECLNDFVHIISLSFLPSSSSLLYVETMRTWWYTPSIFYCTVCIAMRYTLSCIVLYYNEINTILYCMYMHYNEVYSISYCTVRITMMYTLSCIVLYALQWGI